MTGIYLPPRKRLYVKNDERGRANADIESVALTGETNNAKDDPRAKGLQRE